MQAAPPPTSAPEVGPTTEPSANPADSSIAGVSGLGRGVRALDAEEQSREFVLRESKRGNRTLSVIEDDDLVRISLARREAHGVVVEEQFMARKEALLGFSHYRYDWLDGGKYGWWATTGIGIILLLFAPGIGSLIFLAGVLLSLAQFTDPELLLFETNAGQHRVLLYRIGSNRALTDASMDLIDGAMEGLLSGKPLDCEALNERADEIAALVATTTPPLVVETVAVAAPVAAPLPTPVATTAPSTPPPSSPPIPAEQVPPPTPTPAAEPEPEPEPEVAPEPEQELEPEPEPEPEPEVVAELEPEPAPTQVGIPPPPPPPSTTVSEPAPEPAPVPAPTPPPVSDPAPIAAPLPPPPMPVPAPPPNLTPMGHEGQPPPPAGDMAGLPPPPPAGIGGLPPPPPPPGASPFAPTKPVEPTELHVKAAPREDSLSPDEALDLLSDLSE